MLSRKQLENWLEGTNIVLPPPPSFSERIKGMLTLTSFDKLQKLMLAVHFFTMATLIFSLMYKLLLN
ncbi:MAG: hypothetical protein QE277_11940 [Flectobacillus sp.]|nr:hypothetical protein [Flectobacillus sp.]